MITQEDGGGDVFVRMYWLLEKSSGINYSFLQWPEVDKMKDLFDCSTKPVNTAKKAAPVEYMH